jgi:hypothetical protein
VLQPPPPAFPPNMAQPPFPPAVPNGPVIACLGDQTMMMMGSILVPC